MDSHRSSTCRYAARPITVSYCSLVFLRFRGCLENQKEFRKFYMLEDTKTHQCNISCFRITFTTEKRVFRKKKILKNMLYIIIKLIDLSRVKNLKTFKHLNKKQANVFTNYRANHSRLCFSTQTIRQMEYCKNNSNQVPSK